MIMEVEIVSKEFVKPSSPTPPHLKTHKLIILDHFFPPIYVPIVLFYKAPDEDRAVHDHTGDPVPVAEILKHSLSNSLDHFHTFAGRMNDDGLSFDCDCEGEGTGSVFYEAKADFTLSEYLTKPDYALINKLIPPAVQPAGPGCPVAIFQLTRFACGGFSICAYGLHSASDGVSISVFLKHWAATAMRIVAKEEGPLNEIPMPSFEAGSQFPCRGEYPREASVRFFCFPFFREGKCGTRTFVFDSEAIARLKAKVVAESGSMIQKLSRIEAVSAIICKSFAKAIGNKSIWASHLVNLRKRAEPPLPDNSIGNFLWLASVIYKEEGKEGVLPLLVTQFRESMAKVDGDFIKGLQGQDAVDKLRDAGKKIRDLYDVDETEHLGLSSWCGLGIYEVNFGWGKPVWLSPFGPEKPGNRFLTGAVIADAADGEGIEVWLNTGEDDLQAMEKDEELLQYACVDPSPLRINHHQLNTK